MKDYVGQILLVIFFAGLSLSLPFLIIQNTVIDSGEKKQVLGVEFQKNQRLPVYLRIPSIKVYAAIEYVGVAQDGSMEVPSNTVDVGWFNLGPKPGDRGSAVIAGHFDGKKGEKAVFANLNELNMGDKIYIDDDNGTTTTFVVRENRTFDPGYAEEVFSSINGTHLNLITCDGVWDESKKSFSKRLVVFADITH